MFLVRLNSSSEFVHQQSIISLQLIQFRVFNQLPDKISGTKEITSTKSTASVGDTITLSCTFTKPAGITPTVAWTASGTAISSSKITTLEKSSSVKLTCVDRSDNGAYVCKVTYGDYGTSEISLSQYVRDITSTTTEFIGLKDAEGTVSCTGYGDAGTFSWSVDSTELTDGSDYGITEEVTDFYTKSTLVIKDLDSLTFDTVCAFAYTAGGSKDITIQVNAIGGKIAATICVRHDLQLSACYDETMSLSSISPIMSDNFPVTTNNSMNFKNIFFFFS